MGRRERKIVSTYNETKSFHELLVGTGLTRGAAKASNARKRLPKQLRWGLPRCLCSRQHPPAPAAPPCVRKAVCAPRTPFSPLLVEAVWDV
jgi:hypothetical protein